MYEYNLLRRYPRSKRNIRARHVAQQANRDTAMLFEREYFDGTREQGYGGYRYDGRWLPVAEDIVEYFSLGAGDRVLDIGCAKGFLVKDLLAVCPGLDVYGLDVSRYALDRGEPEAKGRLVRGVADALPFPDGCFQAALAINTLHNLEPERCVKSVQELERIAPGRGYIQVDSYRTPEEKQMFMDWVLTAKTAFDPSGWNRLFAEAGYTGAYYWTITE